MAKQLRQAFLGFWYRWLTGETALTFAINSGNADMVRYLLDHGADTEKLNNDGLTVLHFASGEGV